MDLFAELVSGLFRWLINAIGGTVRYLYGTLIRMFRLTKRCSFAYREYLNGPDVADDPLFDRDAHRFNNSMIGLAVLAIVFGLLIAT